MRILNLPLLLLPIYAVLREVTGPSTENMLR
jgi:hypothetical protein